MRNLIVIASIIAFLTSCASNTSPQEPKVLMVGFKIAGGEIVKCPTTDGGPLPAEFGSYKMEDAGPIIEKDSDGKRMFMVFTFGMSVKQNAEPNHIKVEDVTDDNALTIVDDTSPKPENGYWKANADPVLITRESVPWLYDTEPTIKIFRITIEDKNSPEKIILYQPAWFPVVAKTTLLTLVNKNN